MCGYEKTYLEEKGLIRKVVDPTREIHDMIEDIALFKGWQWKPTAEWLLELGTKRTHGRINWRKFRKKAK